MTDARALNLMTRADLYRLAQQHNITGRSRMTKADLLVAVKGAIRKAAPPARARRRAADRPDAVQETAVGVEAEPVRKDDGEGKPKKKPRTAGAGKSGTSEKADSKPATSAEATSKKSKKVKKAKDKKSKGGSKGKAKNAEKAKDKKAKKSKKSKDKKSKDKKAKGTSKKRASGSKKKQK